MLECQFQFEKFSGTMSSILTRELFKRKNCVGVLPFDPKTNKILLVEQCRLGPLFNNDHPWMYEIVAGIVDAGEQQDNTALRESKEEANCDILKLIPIYDYYVTPGYCSETMKLYCGIFDSSKISSGSLYGLAEEHEDIKVHVISLEDALTMLSNGKINNSSTIIALLWLQLNCKNPILF